MRGQVLVVGAVVGDVLLDGDVRVRLLVLRVQAVVAEVAEQVHGQGDLLVRRSGTGRALAAPGEQGARQDRAEPQVQGGAPDGCDAHGYSSTYHCSGGCEAPSGSRIAAKKAP